MKLEDKKIPPNWHSKKTIHKDITTNLRTKVRNYEFLAPNDEFPARNPELPARNPEFQGHNDEFQGHNPEFRVKVLKITPKKPIPTLKWYKK